jgi:hypothetical protein
MRELHETGGERNDRLSVRINHKNDGSRSQNDCGDTRTGYGRSVPAEFAESSDWPTIVNNPAANVNKARQIRLKKSAADRNGCIAMRFLGGMIESIELIEFARIHASA